MLLDKHWKRNEKASTLWYLLGFLGIGYLIALIYVLVSDNKNRAWSLFYLLGIIGSITVYVVFKESDKKFADLSLKLLVGQVIGCALVIAVWIAVSIFIPSIITNLHPLFLRCGAQWFC